MLNIINKLSLVYKQYETLLMEVDTLFDRVKNIHGDCITCKIKCNDCCHAMFDLSFIEAIYINTQFNYKYEHGVERSNLLEHTADVDRKVAKIKKGLFRQLKDAEQSEAAINELMENAAKIRIKCPLLGEDGACIMYQYRPVTCRIYGVPTVIDNKTYVCGKTNFNKGEKYPTIYLEKIQDRLDKLSLEAQQSLGSRLTELHKVYVPLSMALLTNYNEEYLGISSVKEKL